MFNKHDTQTNAYSTQSTARLLNNLEAIQKENMITLFLFLVTFFFFYFTKLILLCNAISFIILLYYFVNRQKRITRLKKEYSL